MVSSDQRPVIGVNLDYKVHNGVGFSLVAAEYLDAIDKAGGNPVLIPHAADLDQVLDHLDGFVLTGGADLDCRRDGYYLHPSMRIMDPQREEFDRRLVKTIAARRMPVLAIGVGMQLLNNSHGGTLHLHLPEDRPKAIEHSCPSDPLHGHAIKWVNETFIERCYRTQTNSQTPIRVSSMHHQAVDDVADGFYVTARCPDGIVEAIESTDPDWFAVGVQFHPEHAGGSAMDRVLWDEFIAEVRTRAGNKLALTESAA